MSTYRHSVWRHPITQIASIFLGVFLVLALLFTLLGWGRPNVAVAIALDLSGSTYQNSSFNAPGTVMAKEIDAVQSYLKENARLSNPNKVKVFGIGGGKALELTKSFEANGEKVDAELMRAIKDANLPQSIKPEPEVDDLNIVVKQASQGLIEMADHCREMVIVSDAGVKLTESVITDVLPSKIKLNAIVFGDKDAPVLQGAALITGGTYLRGGASNLSTFFTENLFAKFNTNTRWIVLWLGCAWVALMWMITLPLDRWILRRKLPMDLAGRFALGNALFWTTATPAIVWRLSDGIAFLSRC